MGNEYVDSRFYLRDDYPLEGPRGKQWDEKGKRLLLNGIYKASPTATPLKDGEAGTVLVDQYGRVLVKLEADLEVNIGNVGLLDDDETEVMGTLGRSLFGSPI